MIAIKNNTEFILNHHLGHRLLKSRLLGSQRKIMFL